jgi:tetratricopeptide (TPR) repeat protein
MFDLKQLHAAAIPAALAQAQRYRLLNEPAEAESICLDILRIDPDNEEALVTLVLSYTDQFPHGTVGKVAADADTAVARIGDEYKRLYYSGIIHERRGKAELQTNRPGSSRAVGEWLRDAMTYYERAEALRPEGNDEALLRWNTCARILMSLRVAEPDVPEYNAIQSE